MSDLSDAIDEALKTEPPMVHWTFISYREKATGKFVGAIIVSTESKSMMDAMRKADAVHEFDEAEVEIGKYLTLEEKELPAKQYLYRLLSREDLEAIKKAGSR